MKGKVLFSLLCTATLCAMILPNEVCRGETDGGWQIPVPIEDISWPAGSADIAVETSGNAFAV